jgi:hypothetical protein
MRLLDLGPSYVAPTREDGEQRKDRTLFHFARTARHQGPIYDHPFSSQAKLWIRRQICSRFWWGEKKENQSCARAGALVIRVLLFARTAEG